ncbi:hypothetical protein C5E45_25455 [Nocardia nova]|uniref:FAD-dependent oxidoreductase 2 FAD binding domain-containing protein n=1 Tax=Nocardia nova TaxID=37330 RepID=A0A2S6AJP3_9NOCA|nr:FAD-dependent oxidoreductase [Nocardia nova]PPJ25445.1 hypothetical protein C5E41_19510 [Nocardia nova]PPJ35427.1 hypothetical protein C5E45_25455 [Nocardia nova]
MTSAIPPVTGGRELSCDVLIVGGGTAGTMAALTAARHGANVRSRAARSRDRGGAGADSPDPAATR